MSKKTSKKAKRRRGTSASKKLLYPFSPELWVVEMWSEQHRGGYVREGWAPTTDANIERNIALISLREWNVKNPNDRFRVTKYRRV